MNHSQQSGKMISVINSQPSLIKPSCDYIVINIDNQQNQFIDYESQDSVDNHHYTSQDHLVLDTSDLEANVYVNIQKPSLISRLINIIKK
jgi:hypothetical protein